MTETCYKKPNRKRPRVYTAKDVGRIVAYARNDGASDILLIAYIMQSFGKRSLSCLLFRVLDILNTAVFLSAILAILKGVLNLSKGLKLIATGKKSRLTLSLIEHLLPARFNASLAAFLLWTGSVEIAAGTLLAFTTAIANNVALYLLMKGVCEAEVDEPTYAITPIDTSTLTEDISDAITVLQQIVTDNI